MSDERFQLMKICEDKLITLKKKYLSILSMQNDQISIFDKARLRHILPEIAYALARIKNGNYGICEETGEDIETTRLLAVPWTRVCVKAI